MHEGQHHQPEWALRTAVNTWLTANGYQTLTAAQVTWLDVLHYVARQVNPGADLSATSSG